MMSVYSVLAGPADALALTSPNGGESWKRGSIQTITWGFEGNPGTQLKILLLNGAITKRILSKGAALGTGSFKWKVPADLPKGNQYRIRIISLQNPSLQDTSEQPFSISMAPPGTKLTMLSPNGGESWQRGTSQTIAWTYSGQPGTAVKVVLLKSGIVNQTIAAQVSVGAAGAGSCSWFIPTSLAGSTKYSVRIKSLTYSECRAQSAYPFTITL
jgi:hypothetical protein